MSLRSRGRLHRTWPQRLLIAINVLGILAALGSAGVLAYANTTTAQVNRIRFGGVLDEEPSKPGAPQNFLLVGTDDASRLPAGDPATVGRGKVEGQRTDTIMILRLDPKKQNAMLLSLPRDLWVPISGSRASQRINSAFATGGQIGLARTIQENFGIPIHHYVQVDLAGFKRLVDAVDGVPVYFPYPTRSRLAGLRLEEAGCHVLNPDEALAFVRARKDYQIQRDTGRWVNDPSSDIGRIARQQLFIRTILHRAVSKGVRSPVKLRQMVDIGVDEVTIDERLRAGDLLDLGLLFRDFDPDSLETFSVPAVDAVRGGADVLLIEEEEAEPIFALFRGDGSDGADVPAPDPAEVRVRVLNGSGVRGQAGETATALAAVGFSTVGTGDGDLVDGSVVRFTSASMAAARLVARHIDGPVTFEQHDDLDGADVVVVTGTGWLGVLDEPRPASEVKGPTTTTTTASSTTSTTAAGTTEGTGGTTTTTSPFLPTEPPPGVECQ